MADIAKCEGVECRVKEMCWRYLAPPDSEHQWYLRKQPGGDRNCSYFWEVTQNDNNSKK